MRKSEREIKDRAVIDEIINASDVVRIGMCSGDKPYVVPMSFGYDGEAFFLHCAAEGQKMDILSENPNVFFEFDIAGEVTGDEEACTWTTKYKSVIGDGVARILSSKEDKLYALRVIMKNYSDYSGHTFMDAAVEQVMVLKIDIVSITGKQSV